MCPVPPFPAYPSRDHVCGASGADGDGLRDGLGAFRTEIVDCDVDACERPADRHSCGDRDDAFSGVRALPIIVETAEFVSAEVDTRQGLLSKV